MHRLVIVVGDDPDQQLGPYADYHPAYPYKVFPDAEDVARMAEEFDLDPGDLEALSQRMRSWNHCPGGVEDGRLFYWSSENPNTRFDYYRLGGSWAGCLPLAFHPGGATEARKRDVDLDRFLERPPTALLVDSIWYQRGRGGEPDDFEAWRRRLRRLLDRVDDQELLTAFDCHS